MKIYWDTNYPVYLTAESSYASAVNNYIAVFYRWFNEYLNKYETTSDNIREKIIDKTIYYYAKDCDRKYIVSGINQHILN